MNPKPSEHELRDSCIEDDIDLGIDYIDYIARKFDQKGVDIFGGTLPTHEYNINHLYKSFIFNSFI